MKWPPHNWVVCHPLKTLNNQGPFFFVAQIIPCQKESGTGYTPTYPRMPAASSETKMTAMTFLRIGGIPTDLKLNLHFFRAERHQNSTTQSFSGHLLIRWLPLEKTTSTLNTVRLNAKATSFRRPKKTIQYMATMPPEKVVRFGKIDMALAFLGLTLMRTIGARIDQLLRFAMVTWTFIPLIPW